MRQLSWPDITVQQFQDIYRLSLTPPIDEMGRVERIICILFNMSEQEVENLPMLEFSALAKQVAFVMSGRIPGKEVKRIKIGKKRYDIIYDPTKLRHRQYVELIHFGSKPIEQMHYIMASVVKPVTWYGRRLKNKAEDHFTISSDLLNARVIDVYHSCVFFCKLYVNLIQHIKAYLVVEMMEKGATKDQVLTLVNSSQAAMAGFIAHEKWQLLKD